MVGRIADDEDRASRSRRSVAIGFDVPSETTRARVASRREMPMPEVPADLRHPVAQELLHAAIPARLAYIGLDGNPRAVPIAFYWNGTDIVMATSPETPKTSALRVNPKVALTIDTETQPPHVLLVRGTASVEVVDGVPDEYLAASGKLVPDDQWAGFEAQVRVTYDRMAKITVTPTWAKVMDFETRAPAFLERRMRAMGEQAT